MPTTPLVEVDSGMARQIAELTDVAVASARVDDRLAAHLLHGGLEPERVVIINDKGTAEGGATALAIANAVGAAGRGLPVSFVTSCGTVSDDLIASGIDVVTIEGKPISASHRAGGALAGLYRPASARGLAKWIAQNDTPGTIYHLHNWAHFMSPSVFGALRGIGRRLVVTTHDYFLTCPNGAQFSFPTDSNCTRKANSLACLSHNCDRRSYADKLWRMGRHAVRRRIYDVKRQQATAVVIHERMLPNLELGGIPPAQMRVVPNPIRPFSPQRVHAENNREILFVGRLTHEKGPDLAAAAARAAGMPIAFVGTGPMEQQLRKMNPDAIFHGWRRPDEIGAICQTARTLVMPSRWTEPYGLVAGEALWSGLPVILSDNANIADEIVAAGAGFAVAKTVPALAEAMRRLGDDDELTRRMSFAAINNTRLIGNTYDDWIDRYIDIYRSLL